LMTQFSTEFVTLTPTLREMKQDNLLEHRDGKIYATELGKTFLRNIAVEFDINRKSGECEKFSQSV